MAAASARRASPDPRRVAPRRARPSPVVMSGFTEYNCSPERRSGSRLVARTATLGLRPSTSATSDAGTSPRCSQLSSTSRVGSVSAQSATNDAAESNGAGAQPERCAHGLRHTICPRHRGQLDHTHSTSVPCPTVRDSRAPTSSCRRRPVRSASRHGRASRDRSAPERPKCARRDREGPTCASAHHLSHSAARRSAERQMFAARTISTVARHRTTSPIGGSRT